MLSILHCGTNDLYTEKNADEIASEILNLANEMKNNTNELIVSVIIVRNVQVNVQVNDLLKNKM